MNKKDYIIIIGVVAVLTVLWYFFMKAQRKQAEENGYLRNRTSLPSYNGATIRCEAGCTLSTDVKPGDNVLNVLGTKYTCKCAKLQTSTPFTTVH